MNVNLTTLPCPRCGKPGPIEARICTCGQKFLRTSTSEEQCSLALVPGPEEPRTKAPTALPIQEPRIKPRRVVVAFGTLILAFALTIIAEHHLATDPASNVEVRSSAVAALGVDAPFKNSEVSTEPPSEHARDPESTLPTDLAGNTNKRQPTDVLRTSSVAPAVGASTAERDENLAERLQAPALEERVRDSGRQAVPTARCADGTFSYSSSSANACSERGGVAERLNAQQEREPALALNRTHQTGPRGGCFYVNASGTRVYVRDRRLCGQD